MCEISPSQLYHSSPEIERLHVQQLTRACGFLAQDTQDA